MSWRLDEAALRDRGGAIALANVDPLATVSYRTFAGRAVAVAEQLAVMGVGRNDPVAQVSKARGVDEPVGLAGILLAGAAVVPLDATAPVARWRQILAAAGCRAIVHDEESRASLRDVAVPPIELGRIELDTDGFVLAGIGDAAPADHPHRARTDLACVLHTSGSTGVPKPIPIAWAALDAFTAWMGPLMGLAEGRRVLRIAELTFDLSLFDHLASWRFGATLGLATRRSLATAKSVASTVAAFEPHALYAVPAFFTMLVKGATVAPANLDRIAFAGEPFPPAALAELAAWAPHARLFNLYGPTETNVCTYHEVRRDELDGRTPIPIGRPCPYASCRLVDERGATIEGEGVGELVVSGTTALDGEVATHDRVARDGEGLLHFRGRLDRMVKIGGRRVEPAEIERALLAEPGVEEAAAIASDHPRLGRRLIAFVAPESNDGTSLRRALARTLPAYMVPDTIRAIPALPRNTRGKVDHAALAG